MRKIIHISNTFIPRDSRVLKEIKSLSTIKGVTVYAVGCDASAGDNIPRELNYISIKSRIKGFKFLPRPMRYFFEIFEFTYKVFRAARSLDGDIVHCHDTFALPAGWFLKLFGSMILIYDAHELESNKNGQNILLSKSTFVIEKLCWAKVDLLVTVSQSIEDWYFANLGVKRSVIVLNSPEIMDARRKKNNNEDRRRYFHDLYDIEKSSLIFVYLGILGPGRGIELVLDAFCNAPKNAHVVFIGSGSLEDRIEEFSRVNENIHHHLPVAHEQVVELVSCADYGLCLIENVSLSDYFCLPNKLFEYAFARLPVLASNFPDMSKMIGDFNLGFYCEPNVESLRSKIVYLVENKPQLSQVNIDSISWHAQAIKLKSAYTHYL